MPTVVKYWLMQLPGIFGCGALLLWANGSDWISRPWATGLFVAWIAKDALLYPLTRHAYHAADPRGGPRVGTVGTVRKPLTPTGTVALNGTLWSAKLVEPGQVAAGGDTVRVVAKKGLVLIVTPEHSAHGDSPSPPRSLR